MSLQQQQQQQSLPLHYHRPPPPPPPPPPPGHRSLFLMTRVLVSIVLVTVLFALIRNLYRAMYHDPRSEAISRDLNFFYDDDDDDSSSNETGAKQKDRVARRDRILRLRERMGVGLDSLPTVRFDSSSSSSASSTPSSSSSRIKKRSSGISKITKDDNDDDDDDEEEEEEEEEEEDGEEEERAVRERQHECLTHGAFVSTTDEFVDCRAYCNVSDGVEYRYYDRLGVLLNGRTGQVGAYCMPTDAAVCNTNTSLVVYGRDDSSWRCLPQMRAFAGEGGNMIVACDGRLLDRATGRIWHQHIDSTLAFDSIDELLPGGGKNDPGMYRFVCPPSRDERGNWRLEAPFDRLVLLNNTCASLIPHADDSVRPDFTRGLCECGSRARYNSTLGTCVPLDPVAVFDKLSGDDKGRDEFFNSKTLETVLIDRSGPCWEPWMTLSQGRELELNATKRKTTTTTMTLCGVEHSSADLGAANSAFNRTHALVFDRVVPSPAAMLLSAPSVTSNHSTAAAAAAIGR